MKKLSLTGAVILALLLSLQQSFSNGQVLINEVAVTGVTDVCGRNDYIELINNGPSVANLSGFVLHDDNGETDEDAFTLPPQFALAGGEIRLLCRFFVGSFQFGIGSGDTVSLIDTTGAVVSTTGVITGVVSSTSTFNRETTGYRFAPPTPGTINFVLPPGKPFINEVAIIGTTLQRCNGGPYIEIYNDAYADVDLIGYKLSAGAITYTFTSRFIYRFAYITLCTASVSFPFGATDDISLATPLGVVVSRTGIIGGISPRTSALDLTWTRVTDYIVTSAPFTPFYQYSTKPTPNALNIFSFEPIQLPIQPCGMQTAPLSMASDYVLKSVTDLDVNGGDPELSGGTFDPRTCNHIVVGDNGLMHEVSISNTAATLIRVRPIIGGSLSDPDYGSIPDSEGVCFYRDVNNNRDKIAILDERAHSVIICDIPLASQLVPLFRDSTNCRVLTLSTTQLSNVNLVNSNDDLRFEAIACDPASGKIYVGNEEGPMLIWSLDVVTGLFEVLIDVQRLPAWTSKIVDISGMTYDPLSKNLYVLSVSRRLILQSTLNGTLVGGTLSVAALTSPEGLSYEPTTGDLLVFGEPNQVARYAPTRRPTKAPTRRPTKSPTKRPTKAPTKAPTKVPTKAPTAPTKTPTKAPTKVPVPPTKVTTKTPTKAPTKTPTKAPTDTPVKAPVKAPVPVQVPVPVKVQIPTKSPTKSPTKAPVKPPTKSPTKKPTKAPMKTPTTTPTKTPTTAPTNQPTKASTTTACGLFGLNIFCPFTFCGFFGRWIGLCDEN